jgi:hypothetical protein
MKSMTTITTVDYIFIHSYCATLPTLRADELFRWKLKLPPASRDAGFVRVLYRSLRAAGLDAIAARQHVVLAAIAFSGAYPSYERRCRTPS